MYGEDTTTTLGLMLLTFTVPQVSKCNNEVFQTMSAAFAAGIYSFSCHCSFIMGLQRCHGVSSRERQRCWRWNEGEVSVPLYMYQWIAQILTRNRLSEGKPLASPVTLGASDTLKIVLTAQESKESKKPHQAFLLLKDPITSLDISYPFSVKEGGKAKVELVWILRRA